MSDMSQPNISIQLSGDATNYGVVVGVNAGTINNIVQVAQVVTSLHQLRAPLPDFVGRTKEITELVAALRLPASGTAVLAAVCGMGGLGKTELALRVANVLLDAYPDAQLFLSLRGSIPGQSRALAEALGAAIRAFNPRDALPDDLDALETLYLGHLGGKRALILLDDVPDEASVRHFLPPAGCALLVTSRMRLTLGGQGTAVDLALFAREEARALLLDDVPRLADDPALDALLVRCGDLPLAVRVCGATLAGNPALAPERYLARLNDERRRPGALRYEDTDVYAILGVGDDLLAASNPSLARYWRMLGVCPAPFEVSTVTSIWAEADEDALDEALGQLLRRSLLSYNLTTRQYRMHGLLCDVAAARRAPADDYTARLRHAQHYMAIYQEAQRLYDAGHDDSLAGLKLFDASWLHMRAAAIWARGAGTPEADQLCIYESTIVSLLALRLPPRELIDWRQISLEAAHRLGDRRNEALALHGIGNGYLDINLEQAKECFEQSLAIAQAIGDRQIESWALNGIGNAASESGDMQTAVTAYQQCLTIRRDLGDRAGEGRVLVNLGAVYTEMRDLVPAIKCYAQSLIILRERGDRRTEAIVLNNMGNIYMLQDDLGQALQYLMQALAIMRELGDRNNEANVCWSIGETLARHGEYRRAAEFMQITVDYERAIGRSQAEEDATILTDTLARARSKQVGT